MPWRLLIFALLDWLGVPETPNLGGMAIDQIVKKVRKDDPSAAVRA